MYTLNISIFVFLTTLVLFILFLKIRNSKNDKILYSVFIGLAVVLSAKAFITIADLETHEFKKIVSFLAVTLPHCILMFFYFTNRKFKIKMDTFINLKFKN